MQPGSDVQGFPLFVRHPERRVRTVGGIAGCSGQHLDYFGHALAVAAGVRALRIDGASQKPDARVEQITLSFRQSLHLERACAQAGQCTDKGELRSFQRSVAQYHNDAQQLVLAGGKRDGCNVRCLHHR
ncbi:hypothetical protein D3C84_716560 [compost metagenome]